MEVLSRSDRSLFMSVLVGLALAAVVLPLFAIANQGYLRQANQAANTANARAQANLFDALYLGDIHAARRFAAAPNVRTFYRDMVNRQLTRPEVTAAYLLGPDGQMRSGLTFSHNGIANGVDDDDAPLGMSMTSATALGKALALTLRHGVETQVFSFGQNTGPLGSLYLFEPATDRTNQPIGALVLRIDNQTLIGRYLTDVLVVAPPFVISDATAGLLRRGQVPVLAGVPAGMLKDPSLFNRLSAVPITDLGQDGAITYGTFGYQGVIRVGGSSDLADLPGIKLIVYSPPPTFAVSLRQIVTGGVGLVFAIFLIAGLAILFAYQENRITKATALLEESKSQVLTDDILNVSQALSIAREGDLTIEVPSAESEVGLVSILINGLLSDYSQMVADIILSSRAVQEGALRVDAGVRSIVTVAAQRSDEMTETAGTIGALAGSAAAMQDATRQATELAGEASQSVRQGQDAVSRIGEAVDSIKEAAIGTTREFKRLQEDSIRLTALVSSVKSNAENLDMQAANAALEARHLGTDTGSAFATNIGRLARQAQETLADAETAVRSVISSIDAVNRRIERISEQVRLGVEEVRSVRTNFEDITATNQSLVQFIDQVAGSTQAQAGNAQQAAAAITAIATSFREFNDLLVSSGDEMAHMRLIVADLQESVSNLKVDEALLADSDDSDSAAPPELAA